MKNMNLPNKLTMLRVILIPFFVVCELIPYSWGKWVALVIFVAASITDKLDGVIAREFIISGFRLIAAENGRVIAAGIWGKAKTVVQMIMCILLIMDVSALSVVTTIAIYAALILTIISLVDYIVHNLDVLSDQK